MKRVLVPAVALAALGAMVPSAQAVMFGPAFSTEVNGDLVFVLSVPTSTVEDYRLEITVAGDLGGVEERINITLDTLNLGQVLDDDPSNDEFSHPTDQYDSGLPGTNCNYDKRETLVAIIPAASYNTIAADGSITLTLNSGFAVGVATTANFPASYNAPASASIYAEGDFSPVPTPGAIALLGLAGLASSKRRR